MPGATPARTLTAQPHLRFQLTRLATPGATGRVPADLSLARWLLFLHPGGSHARSFHPSRTSLARLDHRRSDLVGLVRPASSAGAASSTFTKTFQQAINRNVDMLFCIDDSSSMALSQNNLRRNFPAFMTTLRDAPQGLPNLHVAVVSSDMGAGAEGAVSDCGPNGGKNGIFQYTPKPPPPGETPCVTNLDPGRDVHRRLRRRPELHRRHQGYVLLHRRSRAERVRLRAPVRRHPSRARRGRPGRPAREPGLPAPGADRGDHHDHQRG